MTPTLFLLTFIKTLAFQEQHTIKSSKQRGRPKQDIADKESKEKSIIDAAKKLFNEQGFESVSMRKIASEIGMGTMTLYKYFENKNQVLHHIWGEFFDEMFEQMCSQLAENQDPKQGFRIACHSYLDYWFEHTERFRMVFLNEDRAASNNQFFLHHANMEKRLEAIFTPALSAAFPDKSETELQAQLLSTMCYLNGIALNLITIGEYQWPDKETLLELYLKQLLN